MSREPNIVDPRDELEQGKDDSPVAMTFDTVPDDESQSTVPYKVYKRRFFGLAQLVLLNIVVSWDVREIPYLIAPKSRRR